MFSGRLFGDIRENTSGDRRYGIFNLANDDGYGEKKKTNSLPIFITEKQLDSMRKAGVKKGTAIVVTCRISMPSPDKDSNGNYPPPKVSFALQEWEFGQGNAREPGNTGAPAPAAAYTAPAPAHPAVPSYSSDFMVLDDDDLPF